MRYAITDEYAAAFLEFKGKGIGMLLLKPNLYDGLNALVGTFAARPVWQILDGLTVGKARIELPPLDFISNVAIEAIVKDSSGESDISRTEGRKTEIIRQKTKMKLDKEGVSIRSVTVHGEGEILSLPLEICFDSPFLFAIVDTLNRVALFSGAIRNPLSVSTPAGK